MAITLKAFANVLYITKENLLNLWSTAGRKKCQELSLRSWDTTVRG